MRTIILVTVTLIALTLGFVVYWWVQPAKVSGGRRDANGGAKAPARVVRDTNKPYGPGKGVWVKRYSEETAQIVSRFKAEEYAPRKDGWVEVKSPKAQFFLKDGRAISVEGDTGEVIMDDKAKRTGMKALSESPETPSRGRLHGVRVRLYHDIVDPEAELDDALSADKQPEPALTVVLNNAAFDNQTFKISSERYRQGKTQVEGDQVPITLIGKDYDFYGKGLTIRWNERDQRLQLLEIAHGEKLVIKHPDQFLGQEERLAKGKALSPMLAAKNGSSVGEVVLEDQVKNVVPPVEGGGRRNRGAIPPPKIQRSEQPPLYRAIFHEQVKVAQGQDLLVNAEKMSIDFLLEDQEADEEESGSATRPTTRRVGKSARKARRAAATRAATQPSKFIVTTQPTDEGSRVMAAATTRPSTRASKKAKPKADAGLGDTPVVITWKGKLVVEPLAVGSENPLKVGEAVVRLEGKPVQARQNEAVVECGALVYRTEDQAMLLTPVSPNEPVMMKDGRGAVVRTVRMDYSQPKRVATLYGASDAVFPQLDDAGKPVAGQNVLAKWSRTCTLHFLGDGTSQSAMNIERAELDGDVAVDHSQLKLRSQALELAFEPREKGPTTRATTLPTSRAIAEATTGPSTRSTTRPAIRADLREMIATGAVHCEIIDDQKRTQTIDCNRLSLLTAKTADGKLYPSTINADGAVRAVDPEQELRAGHLAIALKPATKPVGGIATTQASTGPMSGGSATTTRPLTPALSRGEGGQTVNAELESLIAHKDVSVVTKEGAKISADQLLVDNKGGQNVVKLLGQPARIVDKKNAMSGPIIEIHPDAQRLEVFGKGEMKGEQEEKQGEAARPIDVSWARGLVVDGKANTVDVSGQAAAVTTDDKGAVNTAKGEHVKMLLADVTPATKPATQATTKPARSGQYAALSNKAIRRVTFSENAEISSVTMAADGSLLRRVHLEAATVEHDLVLKRLNIPVEGRMIVEDHDGGATTQPSAEAARTAGSGFGVGMKARGATAFKWTKSFTYDDATRIAVMTGSEERPVVIAHRDDSPSARTFHLTGQVVTAEMEEVVRPATQPAAVVAPTTKPAKKEEPKVQLRRVTAGGRLTFAGPGVEVQARQMEFNPKTNVVTAWGEARSPVVFEIASSPGGQKEAEMIQYDIKAGRLVNATRVRVKLNR